LGGEDPTYSLDEADGAHPIYHVGPKKLSWTLAGLVNFRTHSLLNIVPLGIVFTQLGKRVKTIPSGTMFVGWHATSG